jgi:hypothetical protein
MGKNKVPFRKKPTRSYVNDGEGVFPRGQHPDKRSAKNWAEATNANLVAKGKRPMT